MAQITFRDISLKDYKLTPHVSRLKEIYFRVLPEICIERPRLLTRFHIQNGLFKQKSISILDKARAYRYDMENRISVVRHTRTYEKGMAKK